MFTNCSCICREMYGLYDGVPSRGGFCDSGLLKQMKALSNIPESLNDRYHINFCFW